MASLVRAGPLREHTTKLCCVLYLADVAGGRVGRVEREAAVLAGEAVGGVHVAVAARAEGGLVGAAEHARLGRLARGAEHLHRSVGQPRRTEAIGLVGYRVAAGGGGGGG